MMPVVDPRGLVMPFFDSWSLDAWVVSSNGHALIPSRAPSVHQRLVMEDDLVVETCCADDVFELTSRVRVVSEKSRPVCELTVSAMASKDTNGFLAISLRPYNPEGISFINQVERLGSEPGWKVNQEHEVRLSVSPERFYVSTYDNGDVYHKIPSKKGDQTVNTACRVGMASAAALFQIDSDADAKREITASVPLDEGASMATGREGEPVETGWIADLKGRCELNMADQKMVYLYDTALRTLVLHTPDDVYAGP
jgi:hypothetical protein